MGGIFEIGLTLIETAQTSQTVLRPLLLLRRMSYFIVSIMQEDVQYIYRLHCVILTLGLQVFS